jgi:Glycosyltransferase like family 2
VLNDTALVVTAWRRPDYLRRTLASWAAVPGTGELRMVAVALGPSHLLADQMAVIEEAEEQMGRRIVVLQDSPAAVASPGMHRALGEAIDRLFADFRPEFVICGEEDVIVSDDVLAYTAWGQGHYGDEVLCICAHNRGGAGWDGLTGIRADADADQAAVRRLAYFSPWVWCIRRDRWTEHVRENWDWDCTSSAPAGYDWQMQRIVTQGEWVNLVPDAARSQTIGELAGVYSTPGIFPMQQAQSFREHRGPVSYHLA